MFSALKKLVGSEGGQLRERNIPAGLQSMNQSLQRRFAKGVQYNMKIVIRGDRNTGKSALWHRLQGKKFIEEYIPTQEIQVTSIHWNYKTTDDVVKVEVWDVVDKAGKGKKRGDNLKLENEPQESEAEMALDAEFLDVYKNCNGVIMMFDITKQWTFNYIMRELPKVPMHVPVCVLGNQRDMGEHRVILPDDTRDFISSLNRPRGSSYIHYAESSMKNGFGLKYLHRFFNIPFLQLQRETLLRQLETNQLDIDATLEELNVQQETEDQNYEIFMDMMEARGKGYNSPGPTNGQSPSSGSQSPVVPPGAASPSVSSPSTPQAPPQTQPIPVPHPASAPRAPPQAAAPQLATPTQAVAPSHPVQQLHAEPPVASSPPTSAAAAAPPQKRGFMSRLFGGAAAPEQTPDLGTSGTSQPTGKVQSVDDFMPELGLDKSFLEDGGTSAAKSRQKARHTATLDSDSDGEGRGGNPLVSGFQDDLDPDDRVAAAQPLPQVAAPSLDVTLTSDEEEVKPSTAAAAAYQDKRGSSAGADLKGFSMNSVLKPQPAKTKAVERPATLKTKAASPAPQRQAKKTGGAVEAESSDSDHGGPVAKQMLSFVMDDPDFESEDVEIPKTKKESFPGPDDLSDRSDDCFGLTGHPEPPKASALSFKSHNSDIDLFGLAFNETPSKSKDSSEDQEDNESRHSGKEKKKKKKKSKEEEEKSSKKRHKHKKKEREDSGTGDEKDKEKEKEKKKKKSKTKKASNVDDLEAFLAGGDGPSRSGGGDYEEL
ncbi:rab-like protein 6 isoform X1 [Alosa sapidissima]|uniref:rab-like protein 6 isoform X1 n=1 Tax=Alosa sapidissima TaxID=34773 RepID=UPI001C093B22|nr:rab-like protein 6 isoform X1 [Alosa sapidissima]XP_041915126.1 rab-like protein 6 isoform X1 [Alosa sapidissima]